MNKIKRHYHPVESLLEQETITQSPRPYLGMSQLGHECERFLWYYVNEPEHVHLQYTPRQIRIFDRGHYEEEVIKKELREKDFELEYEEYELVLERNGETIRGHCDGVIRINKVYLVEIKAVKNSKWNEIKKKGIKEAAPLYYVQGQVYLKLMRDVVDELVFIVANKDTEERQYIKCPEDSGIADRYIDRGFRILTTWEPPKRIGPPLYYQCKWCAAHEYCHYVDERS